MNTSSADAGSLLAERGVDRRGRVVIKRHTLVTLTWHWLNFVCMTMLLMSGLQIFNAHPHLYWGSGSNFDNPALSIGAVPVDGRWQGALQIGGYRFNTTGVLGLSWHDGEFERRAFPRWATLPGPRWLAMGRLWHFFFAWIFVPLLLLYLVYSITSGHLRDKLWPRAHEWRGFGRMLRDHLRLKFPRGDEARHYNILQKLAYLLVLFVLAPLIVLTGLTMSPTVDAAWPWLPIVFGGRQSARTIHFICAFSLLAFFCIHIALVLLSGVINNVRSMFTGRYALPPARDEDGESDHGQP